MVSTVVEAAAEIESLYPERISIIDKLTNKNAPTAYVHSRIVGASTRHFIANIDEKRNILATVHIPSDEKMAIFDLCDGRLYRLKTNGGSFDATLSPSGALVVICGQEADEAVDEPPPVLGSGTSFEDFSTILPAVVVNDFVCTPLEENVFLLNDSRWR